MAISDETKQTRQSSLGWMVQRLAARLNRAMNTRLAELDLSLPQFAVMMMALEHGPLTQSDIGKRYDMQPYAISRALDHLQNLGLVDRVPHPTSRRAHQIMVTKAGLALAPRLIAIVQEVNSDLVTPLSGAETAQLLGLMARLVGDEGEGCN